MIGTHRPNPPSRHRPILLHRPRKIRKKWTEPTWLREALSIAFFLALFLPAAVVFAGITELTCQVSAPNDLTKTYNAGQAITLQATWKDGTPPFAATFKTGGATIGTANTSQGSANFAVPAANLPEGPSIFAVTVVETSVPNASSIPDVPAPGAVNIDKQPPTITITVSSGNIVSPATGHNEVLISFSSSETLGEAPKFTVSPGSWPPPTPVSPEAAPFSSNQYKIVVPAGTPAGAYTVRAVGRDNTEPAATRNEGAGQTVFTVDAAADGPPVITGCHPPSPLRTESLQLSGSVQAETGPQRIEVLEGTTVVATVQVETNATSWAATVSNVTEGRHGYTVRRTDPLGNVSAGSPEWRIIADRTPPSRPQLLQPKTPTNQQKITISGTGVVDPPYDSGPVRVTLTRDGTPVGSTTANPDGSFSFADVPLVSGSNVFFAQSADRAHDGSAADPGNPGAFSNPVEVKLDTTPPVIVDGGIIISQPLSALLFGFPGTGPNPGIGRRPDTLFITDGQPIPISLREKVQPWSTVGRGLPSSSVLVAFRRILAPAALLPKIRSRLAAAGQAQAVELRESGDTASPPPGFIVDLVLLKAGRLPDERIDLLVRDIADERIPLFLLPNPERCPPNTSRRIGQAIRFRLLHGGNGRR